LHTWHILDTLGKERMHYKSRVRVSTIDGRANPAEMFFCAMSVERLDQARLRYCAHSLGNLNRMCTNRQRRYSAWSIRLILMAQRSILSYVILASPFRQALRLYVQLQEFGSKYEPEMLRSSKKTDLADAIVYVHDSSDTNSFSYISNLRVCFFCVALQTWVTNLIMSSNNTAWTTSQPYSLRQSRILILPSNDMRCNPTYTAGD
jgi:hypothetical protein